MVKETSSTRLPTQEEASVKLKRSRVRVDGSDLTDSSSNNTAYVGGPQVSVKKNTASHGLAQENSYRLQPDHKFHPKEVERVAEQVLVDNLQDINYEPVLCKRLSQELASKIMDSVKTLQIKRYKLIAVVSIGSIKERPGMQFGSRCLWNQETDTYASVKFTNGSLFAVAMVYGLYFE